MFGCLFIYIYSLYAVDLTTSTVIFVLRQFCCLCLERLLEVGTNSGVCTSELAAMRTAGWLALALSPYFVKSLALSLSTAVLQNPECALYISASASVELAGWLASLFRYLLGGNQFNTHMVCSANGM